MKKIESEFLNRRIQILIILLIPFMLAWEDIGVRDILTSPRDKEEERQEEEKRIREELSTLKIKPFEIIQKMESAMFEANGFKSKMEIWLQHPAYHTNIKLNQQFQDLDKIYVTGRTSLSFLIPETKFSTSEWIQTFYLEGQSYVFDPIKNNWQREKVKLSKKQELAAVEYGLFQSLAAPKTDFVLEDTISIISLQKFKGKDCFVLQFNLDPKIFKERGLVGSIDNYKVWLDRQNFYPYMFRIEGSVGDIKFLQVVEYFDFDLPITLKLPPEIVDSIEKEHRELLQKTEGLVKKIKDLRGGSPPEGLKIDFIDRRKLRKYVKEKIQEEYSLKELYNLEIIFKWMGLLPSGLDYKELLINSATSSIGGFYEPREKAFYISDWIPTNLAESILSHELMHAFQDQAIGLENFLKEQKYLDQFYARQFLLEGEATAVMLQLVFDKQNKKLEEEEDLLSIIKEKLLAEGYASSKTGYSGLTYSGYAYGARFIQEAIKTMGWQSLDTLYRKPPEGMKELMHPEIYFGKKKETKKMDWSTPVLKGWHKFYQNSLGEFSVRMWLERFLDKEESEIAAEGLKSDEIILYSSEGKKTPLVIFLTEWESTENAQEFWSAYQRLQDKKWKDTAKKQEEKDYIIWYSDTRDDFITLNENLLLIASTDKLDKEEIDTLLAFLENSLKSP